MMKLVSLFFLRLILILTSCFSLSTLVTAALAAWSFRWHVNDFGDKASSFVSQFFHVVQIACTMNNNILSMMRRIEKWRLVKKEKPWQMNNDTADRQSNNVSVPLMTSNEYTVPKSPALSSDTQSNLELNCTNPARRAQSVVLDHICSQQYMEALWLWALNDGRVWYESELSLNHYMSDIFDHWCGLNIHPLRPGQACKTLWDYLESSSPAQHVLRLPRSPTQISCE